MGSIREEDEQERVDGPDQFNNNNIDAWWRDLKIHALHHRIPTLSYRGQITGLAGMYTMNFEDVHAVVGPTDLEGFVVCNGFSGHGFKESPAIGSMLAHHLADLERDEYAASSFGASEPAGVRCLWGIVAANCTDPWEPSDEGANPARGRSQHHLDQLRWGYDVGDDHGSTHDIRSSRGHDD